ncbi:hypothetical protein LWI28_025484 [Acer negundo]|uniref:Uncharacterized protein n=1 Tax=Acer negundo TaxID=4023 RepID=A0AAD5JKN4_ACENE|nr:hypothetical protein LWI28_025484 [Acer negundo]
MILKSDLSFFGSLFGDRRPSLLSPCLLTPPTAVTVLSRPSTPPLPWQFFSRRRCCLEQPFKPVNAGTKTVFKQQHHNKFSFFSAFELLELMRRLWWMLSVEVWFFLLT